MERKVCKNKLRSKKHMTEIFNLNKIKSNDLLREKKVEVLNEVKNRLQEIDEKIKLET